MDDKTPKVYCKTADFRITMPQCLMMSQKELTFWGPDAAKFNKGCPCPKREEALMARKYCKECGRPVYNGTICTACRKAEKERAEEEKTTMITGKTEEATTGTGTPVTRTGAGHAAEEPTKRADAVVPRKLDGNMKRRSPRPAKPCVICGAVKPSKGRGMCGVCYYAHVENPAREAKAAAKIMPVKATTTNIETPKSLDLALTSLRHTIKKPSPVKEKTDEQALITLAFRDETDMKIYSFIEDEARRCRRTPDQQAIWMLQSHLPESRAAVFYKAHGDHLDKNPGPL